MGLLSEETRKALNELTLEEVSREVSYAYEHEILWYGIDSVVHFHLMNKARDIYRGRISLDEFVKKYNLDFSSNKNRFVVSLEKIESDDIFIPKQVYLEEDGKKWDRRVHFFNKDYGNRVCRDSWIDKEYAWKLMNIKWRQADLRNIKLVEQGVKFGRDMWQTCVKGFYRVNEMRPQPKKVTDLAEKLIEYYSSLLD